MFHLKTEINPALFQNNFEGFGKIWKPEMNFKKIL